MTTGIVVVMAQNGVITLDMAIPILLGSNLGTPTTALLVASRMNISAKRAAVAHFLFNFLGVLLFLPLLGPFTGFIESLGGTTALQVANAHLIFNLTCCIVFLILIGPFSRLVMRVVPGREDDIVFMPKYLRHPLPVSPMETITLIEQEIKNLLTIPGRLLEELEGMVDKPKKYSQQVGQLRDYAKYIDTQISESALKLSGQNLTSHESVRIAALVRISKLGQVLAEQTGELVEIIHGVQDKGIIFSEESKAAVQLTLIPCTMNLKTLADNFPKISDPINEAMREQDDILRDTITHQYQEYLDRFASHKTPSGSEFSRVLFQIEGMAATIREIRKSTRLLGSGQSGEKEGPQDRTS